MSWRLPFGLLFVLPVLIICSVWAIPEVSFSSASPRPPRQLTTARRYQSPRWYLLKGRKEDALGALTRLRRGCFSDEEIRKEIEELQVILDETVEQGSFGELFRGPNLKRTVLSVAVNFFLHITGQNFVSVYGTIFIKSLNTVNPFTMTSANAGINIVLVVVTMLLVDRVGRV